jgi:glyoxylase I family protein
MSAQNASQLQFDHVAVPVRDAAATHAFYAQVLGLPLIDAHEGDDWGGLPWLMMIFAAGDGRQLAFIAFAGGDTGTSNLPADARHYAFSVASNARLEEWKKKLVAAKVRFTEEDHGTQQSIYFADPNGITLEITAPASSASPRPNPKAASVIASWAKTHAA